MVWLTKQKESGPKSLKSEIKKERLQLTPQKYKASKRLLQTTICKWNAQPRRMDKFLEMFSFTRLNQEEIENMEDHLLVIKWISIFFFLIPNKSKTRGLHRWILPNIYSKFPTYEPSSCRLSKMWMHVHMSNYASQFMHPVCIVTCMHYLEVFVFLCTK